MTPEDRRHAIGHFKEHWRSLSPLEKAEHLSEFYGRAREKIKAAGGMLTNRQAFQELANEDMRSWLAALEEMIATEEEEEQEEDDEGNNNNRAILQHWHDNLLPPQAINEIDVAIAHYLKRVQKTHPDFALLKFDYHRENPEEFDRLKKELEDKGLL